MLYVEHHLLAHYQLTIYIYPALIEQSCNKVYWGGKEKILLLNN